MNNQKQGKTNTEFVQIICTKYANECIRLNQPETKEGLVRYMMQYNIINEKEVNRYMVQELYPRAMYENQNRKSQAVNYLENCINLHERQIYTILQDCYKRFKKRAIDFF